VPLDSRRGVVDELNALIDLVRGEGIEDRGRIKILIARGEMVSRFFGLNSGQPNVGVSADLNLFPAKQSTDFESSDGRKLA